MECREIEARLYLYVDGELTATEKMDIDRHLRICEACRALLADLESENRILKESFAEVSLRKIRLDQVEEELITVIQTQESSFLAGWLSGWKVGLKLVAPVFILSLFMSYVHFDLMTISRVAGYISGPIIKLTAVSLIQLFIGGCLLLISYLRLRWITRDKT